MPLSFWFRLHLLGWQIWLPATLAFAIATAWAMEAEQRRHLLPWLSLLILLAAAAGEDLLTAWHRVYWQSRPVWGAGMLSILVVGMLPLAACLAARPMVRRLPARFGWRAAALSAAALVARLLLGAPLYHWIQHGLLG